MDGTIVDSMRLMSGLLVACTEKLGIKMSPEVAAQTRYIPIAESADLLKSVYELDESREEIIGVFYQTLEEIYRKVELKEGALDFLKKAKAAGIKLAVATATEPPLARGVMERLGILSYMDCTVSCSEVGKSKASPDVFLKCAALMGTLPEESAVFEDGILGAASAKAAGFFTVGVADDASADERENLISVSNVFIESFVGTELI